VHCGERAVAAAGVASGLIGLGGQVTWRAKHFGVWRGLTSRTTKVDRPKRFQGVQVHGIFPFMQHDRFFRPLSPIEAETRGVFSFAAPLPLLGLLADAAVTDCISA
jgi:hypothetical protein